ncbi:hypothetical protein HU200_065464 [Digitaria exilis]|uniref:60S ribosomal protein L27 n=1 Tax=Digitaria exilis TaxID=1010633 RepID=A0A834ZY72_9POAL|nr:hypothetical protein HU200_065464 [Digitaria exilis]
MSAQHNFSDKRAPVNVHRYYRHSRSAKPYLPSPPTTPRRRPQFAADEEEERTGGEGGGAAAASVSASAMVKFLKPGKAVILLQGGSPGARRRAPVERPYGHCLVAGLAKYPKKVIRKDSAKKTAKELVNFTHIMPTRYTLDVDLKGRTRRSQPARPPSTCLEERFKTGKKQVVLHPSSASELLACYGPQRR